MEIKHPELREGEVFLHNCRNGTTLEPRWKSERNGTVAYDIDGNILRGSHPVFAERKEIEAAGIEIDGKYNFFLRRD